MRVNLELLTLAGVVESVGKCLRLSKRAEEKREGSGFSQLATESPTHQRVTFLRCARISYTLVCEIYCDNNDDYVAHRGYYLDLRGQIDRLS